MNEDRFDIIIGGGGFVGLAFALGLAKSAPGLFRVVIVEKMSADTAKEGRFDGRSVALIPAAQHMLEALGLWDRISGDAQPVETIEITDSQLEMPVRTPLLSFGEENSTDSPLAYIIENALLRRALYEAVDTLDNVKIISPVSARDITLDEAGARVMLDNGQTLIGRLLVAADGRQSALSKMAGFKTVKWESGQAAITGTVAHEHPHHGRAVQHFLPSGPFAILPMTGNRSSIVWTEREREARRIMELGEAQQIEEIEKRMGFDLGKLSISAKLFFYPLTMTLARSFVKPRIALAGDAAHGLHWIAGQGLNHGLKDVAALTEVLTDAGRLGLDPGDVSILERYERWRRFDSASSAMASAALNRMFANDIMPLRMARQFGLGIVNRLPLLKSFLKQEAAGLTGELPKLLRGELA